MFVDVYPDPTHRNFSPESGAVCLSKAGRNWSRTFDSGQFAVVVWLPRCCCPSLKMMIWKRNFVSDSMRVHFFASIIIQESSGFAHILRFLIFSLDVFSHGQSLRPISVLLQNIIVCIFLQLRELIHSASATAPLEKQQGIMLSSW